MNSRTIRHLLAACFILLGAHSAVAQSITLGIDPRSTYLRTNSDPGALDAIPYELAGIGLQPGDLLLVERLGFWKASLSAADETHGVLLLFSSSDTLLPSTNLNRVPGAIEAGTDIFTRPTAFGSIDTDIPEDFGLLHPDPADSFQILIPVSATHLFLAARDSFFSDNSDPNGDFAVRLSVVPEPMGAATDCFWLVVRAGRRRG